MVSTMWLGYDEQAAIDVAKRLAKKAPATAKVCRHRVLHVMTERDRCTWVECLKCGEVGPKKHSVTLALLAWILFLSSDHPKRRKA